MIAAEAVKAGVYVLRPIVEGGRYDLAFDINGHFVRVQCKTGSLNGGVITASDCERVGTRRAATCERLTNLAEVDAIADLLPGQRGAATSCRSRTSADGGISTFGSHRPETTRSSR